MSVVGNTANYTPYPLGYYPFKGILRGFSWDQENLDPTLRLSLVFTCKLQSQGQVKMKVSISLSRKFLLVTRLKCSDIGEIWNQCFNNCSDMASGRKFPCPYVFFNFHAT